MRTEGHAFFRHFAQFVQAEDLKPTGIGKDRPWPRHKTVQPAERAHLFDTWPQVEVIGIAQQNFHAQFFKDVLRHALDRGQSPHRHKHRGLHYAVRSDELARPRRATSSFNLKL